MMRIFITEFVTFLLIAGVAHAEKPSDKQAQKVIKTVVNAIRYKKDDLATKNVAFNVMTEKMLGEGWSKTNATQKKELIAGVETLIRRLSFAKARDMFKHLDAILYDPVREEKGLVLCKTTVVVHRNYKKTEIVIDFVLSNKNGRWQIADTIMLNESTAAGIYEDQVEPLLDEGGIPKVLKALRDKIAEVKS